MGSGSDRTHATGILKGEHWRTGDRLYKQVVGDERSNGGGLAEIKHA